MEIYTKHYHNKSRSVCHKDDRAAKVFDLLQAQISLMIRQYGVSQENMRDP